MRYTERLRLEEVGTQHAEDLLRIHSDPDVAEWYAGAWTREDGPPKPSPAGAVALCRLLAVRPSHALVGGDYKFDVLSGRDAGCRTALLVGDDTPSDLADWGPPDLVIASLRDLLPLWR